MSELTTHIKALGYMLEKMDPPEPYRAALEAAKVRLMRDESADSAERRTTNDWPHCPRCGAAYVGQPTDFSEVRSLVPGCDCHLPPVWKVRPASDEWNYLHN